MSDEQPAAMTFDELLEHLDDLRLLAESEGFSRLAAELYLGRAVFDARRDLFGVRDAAHSVADGSQLRQSP